MIPLDGKSELTEYGRCTALELQVQKQQKILVQLLEILGSPEVLAPRGDTARTYSARLYFSEMVQELSK